MLTCNDPDVNEPMVMGGVLSSNAVQHTTEHTNDQREDQGEDTVLRLVNATVALSAPLDKSVGTVSEERESDDGSDDLTTIGVASTVLSPIVRSSSNNATISRADGDIGTQCQAVQAESPEDIGEEEQAEHLLAVAVSGLKNERDCHSYLVDFCDSTQVRLSNPETQIRTESTGVVTNEVELGSDGAQNNRR